MPRRESLVCERHWSRSWKIEGLQFGNLKAGTSNELIDLAIKMTITREPLPNRCQSILPCDYPRVRCASVLDKNKRSGRP